MSPPASGTCGVCSALIPGCDGLDLLHNFDRSPEAQHVTIGYAREFPLLKPVTPWIVGERGVADGIGHSILDMHVPMRLAHTGPSRSRSRVVTHRTAT